jgi:hypothetical protein
MLFGIFVIIWSLVMASMERHRGRSKDMHKWAWPDMFIYVVIYVWIYLDAPAMDLGSMYAYPISDGSWANGFF